MLHDVALWRDLRIGYDAGSLHVMGIDYTLKFEIDENYEPSGDCLSLLFTPSDQLVNTSTENAEVFLQTSN